MQRDDSRDLSEVTFIPFDTETTGLVPIAGRLVELGAVCFHLHGHVSATFEQLIDPEEPIPDDARRIHGITDAMVCGCPTIAYVLPQFVTLMGSPDRILVAHNARFDLGFLTIAMARLGLPCPPHRIFDTLALARTLLPGLPGYSLGDVARALGIAKTSPHRALGDALLVKEIFRSLLRRNPWVKTVADLARVTAPLTFHDAQVQPIDLPLQLTPLALALTSRCALMLLYETGNNRSIRRAVTPSILFAWQGATYLAGYCHRDAREKVFRLDRIRACWLPAEELS